MHLPLPVLPGDPAVLPHTGGRGEGEGGPGFGSSEGRARHGKGGAGQERALGVRGHLGWALGVAPFGASSPCLATSCPPRPGERGPSWSQAPHLHPRPSSNCHPSPPERQLRPGRKLGLDLPSGPQLQRGISLLRLSGGEGAAPLATRGDPAPWEPTLAHPQPATRLLAPKNCPTPLPCDSSERGPCV